MSAEHFGRTGMPIEGFSLLLTSLNFLSIPSGPRCKPRPLTFFPTSSRVHLRW